MKTPHWKDLYSPGKEIKAFRTSNTFSIEDVCQEGGMGLVFIARRKKDNRLYALKTLRGWDKEREKLIKNAALFRKEGLVWITLGKYRNIVQALWFDVDEYYRPFLIMEYIQGSSQGVSLRHWLKKGLRIDIPLGIRFALEAVNGLIYAKKTINKNLNTPFIHRDIKPENLLVTRDGILKVTDFGLVMGRGGTYYYMPPEQWNRREVEEKTDIYALGCVLYEILKGQIPFWGITMEDLKSMHFNNSPLSIEGIPDELNRIILECLAKSPDERPDFTKLRDELRMIYKEYTGGSLPLQEDLELLSAEDLNARGSGFDQLEYYKEALDCYNESIALDPDNPKYYLNRGTAHLSLKELKEAGEDYQRALAFNPNSEDALLGLGNLSVQKGEYEKALEYYHHAADLSPEEPMIYVSLGTLYAMQGFYEKATTCFKKALSLRPHLAEAYMGLGNVNACQGAYDGAKASYQNAIGLNPLYTDAYLNMARVYQLMGCYEEREDALKILNNLLNKSQ